MAQESIKPQGPCAGVRVLDLSRFVAGPYAGQVLADLGAEVIKVEPPAGEMMRHGAIAHKGLAAGFEVNNRGKKSIVVDLRKPHGRDVMRKLADVSDVIIENFRPGVMEEAGLGYEDLRKTNPRLIYLKVTGFGDEGPYVNRPAFDQVIQAMAGLMPVQGDKGPPMAIFNYVVDKITATWGANAILGALYYRERTGEGQRIATNLLSAYSAFVMQESLVDYVFADAPKPPPGPPISDSFVPHKTKDGYVLGLVLLDAQFKGFCEALERPDLLVDPRFDTANKRSLAGRQLVEAVADTMARFTSEEFVERAARFDVPFAKVNDVEGFLNNPQVRAAQCVVEFDDPEFGHIVQLNHPVRYEKSPADAAKRAPKMGEHSAEIAALLGLQSLEG
ncbi:MAG: CaiB/BaiF CoA transferase family protein [Hyphomonadaceae bacterium]